MISTSESIVSQVAAKIAAELVHPAGMSLEERLSEWSTAFQYVKNELFEVNEFGTETPTAFQAAFPGTTQVKDEYSQPFAASDAGPAPYKQPQYASAGGVRIKGDQYGPLPDWLLAAAAKAGVSEVYDNRNQLQENPARPWFRSTSGGREAPAFWPARSQ